MRKERDLCICRRPLRRQEIQSVGAFAGSCPRIKSGVAQDDEKRSAQGDDKKSTQDGNTRKLITVLIVEDNLIAGRALKNMLLKINEPADLVVTGEEAIEKIKIHQYRLILMDIGLPGKDGCEVTKIIREWEKAHHLPPSYIVAQSSHLDADIEKKCMAVGMNACYHKPLSTAIIANLIKPACYI